MEEMTFIWHKSPEIWAAIISGCFALVSGAIALILFGKKNRLISKLNKELETHKSELERKNIEIQTALNTQLEKVRIQYGTTHSKRLDTIYEACERMTATDKWINRFVSYHNYDCLPNLDFSKDCKGEHACDKDCIVHYHDKLIEFRNYTLETSAFFEKNEMFFSLETVIAHLKFATAILKLSAEAIDIAHDLTRNERERAVDCFKLFDDLDKKVLIDIRTDLISQYRSLIGVPVLMKF